MALNPVSTGDPHVPAHNEERTAINNLSKELEKKISLPAGAAVGDILRWDGTKWSTTETRIFEGNGRPDDAFAAPVGSRYYDKAATNGAVEWVKRSGGDTNQGWLCVSGDTGRRNISSLIKKLPGVTVNVATVQRVGSLVDYYFDLVMPNSNQAAWEILGAMPGFQPDYNRYAVLQDNSEVANTGGTLVAPNGSITIFKTIGGKRDRYAGTYLTQAPWPRMVGTSAL